MDAVHSFGGKAVMTSPHHQSGTERCAEVAEALNLNPDDVVVNIQGDEPYIRSEAINLLISQFLNPETDIATLAKEFLPDENPDNPNMVKVTFSATGRALAFSRSPIPYYRNTEVARRYFKHIGIYAYRYRILREIVKLPLAPLENAEKLEQLRWLENDFTIRVASCDYESVAIDTPEDLVRAEQITDFL